MQIAEAVLIVYSLAATGMLLVFLWRVAFFYEKTSGQHVGYHILVLPALLLAAGMVWYIVRDVAFIGQSIADILLCGGGAFVLAFGFRLQDLMTGERG